MFEGFKCFYKKIHPVSMTMYFPRQYALLLLLLIFTPIFQQEQVSLIFWIILYIHGLLWPLLILFASSHYKTPKKFEMYALFLDSAVVGLWLGLIAFYPLVLVPVLIGLITACVLVGGVLYALSGLICTSVFALLVNYFVEIPSDYFQDSLYVQAMAILGVIPFLFVVILNMYKRNCILQIKRYQISDINGQINELNELTKRVNTALNVSGLLKYMIDSLKHVFDLDQTIVFCLDKEQNVLVYYTYCYHECDLDEDIAKIRPIQFSLDILDNKDGDEKSYIVNAFKSKKYIYLGDVTENKLLSNKEAFIYREKPFKSMLLFPILLKDRAIGVLGLLSNKGSQLPAQNGLNLISQYVAQLAVVMNNKCMFEKAEEVQEQFDKKNKELEQLSEKLSHYLDPQVYRMVFSDESEIQARAVRKRLTILFADVDGFSVATEDVEPAMLAKLLNVYLTSISRVVIDFGGTIDKFIGDELMIFFGNPNTKGVKQDAIECLSMALAIQKVFDEVKSVWANEFGFDVTALGIRMGVNSGYSTVGNFGSKYRMHYTVIGDHVNLAARIHTAAKPNDILISTNTYLLVKKNMSCIEGEQVTLKGIMYPVQTYVVKGKV